MERDEKKRRRDGGAFDGKRRRDGVDGTALVTEEAEDEEVEEFFAILKRIHVAANYLKRRGGAGRDFTAEARRSLAVLETECFDGVSKEEEEKRGEGFSAESPMGLDLNLDPPNK